MLHRLRVGAREEELEEGEGVEPLTVRSARFSGPVAALRRATFRIGGRGEDRTRATVRPTAR